MVLHEHLHLWLKRMMIAYAYMVRLTALDIQVSLRNPTAILEYSMTSVKTLYKKVCDTNWSIDNNFWRYHHTWNERCMCVAFH